MYPKHISWTYFSIKNNIKVLVKTYYQKTIYNPLLLTNKSPKNKEKYRN